MLLAATQLRVGHVIMHNNELYKIMKLVHVTPGNWRGMVQTKLRKLSDGSQTEQRFGSTEKVEKAQLNEKEMEYIYNEGEDYYFMDLQTFDQLPIHKEVLDESVLYLVHNEKIRVTFHEGNPVGIELPMAVTLKVVATEPFLKGATQSGSTKPATLETGLVVQVPQFVKEGELIKVNTENGKYIERA